MADLQGILRHVAQRIDRAGGAVSAELTKELRAYQTRQFWLFMIVEAVVVIGVAVCAYLLTSNPGQTKSVSQLAGLIGIGTGGGIEVMRRIWKEWSQADLLLVLATEASEAQVSAMLDKLIEKM